MLWFVAKDASDALGLNKNGRAYAMSQLGKDQKANVEKKRVGQTNLLPLFKTNAARVALISESGLYKLVMRSDKPQARAFQATSASR